MIPDQIELHVDIAAPMERVWKLITEADHIKVWYAFDGAEIDLRPGGAVVYRWIEHGEFHGVVERVEPPRFLAVRSALVPSEPPRPGNSTRVEFTLTPEGGGTRLRVVERGFRDLDMTPEQQAACVGVNVDGWSGGLGLLQDHAQRVDV